MQYSNRKNIEPRALGKRWAAVEVRQVSGRVYKIVSGSLCTLDPVTMVIERPDLKIIDENGEEMQPTGTFFGLQKHLMEISLSMLTSWISHPQHPSMMYRVNSTSRSFYPPHQYGMPVFCHDN